VWGEFLFKDCPLSWNFKMCVCSQGAGYNSNMYEKGVSGQKAKPTIMGAKSKILYFAVRENFDLKQFWQNQELSQVRQWYYVPVRV
jgi:hypothetical protein